MWSLKRIMIRLAKIFGMVALALFGLSWGLRELLDFSNKANFDPVIWHESQNCGRDGCDAACIRGAMLRDLKKNYLKTGMPRDKITALLGYEQHPKSHLGDCLIYSIGMCGILPIDYNFMHICFGTNGRLEKVYY